MKKLILIFMLFTIPLLAQTKTLDEASYFTKSLWKLDGTVVSPASTAWTLTLPATTFTGTVTINGVQTIFVPNQTNYVGTIFFGNGGGSLNNTGTDAGDFNTYVGVGTGLSTTIAKKNTSLGWNTLSSATSGWANTAVGYNALSTGVGTGSLDIGGTGIEFYANTAVGANTLAATTTGSYNTAVGTSALLSNTVGSFNTAYGVHALNDNTEGTYNVAIGHSSLRANLTGARNIAIGYGTSLLTTAISDQIAIGNNALANNLTGTNSVAIGTNSLVANTNSNSNIAVGYNSLYTANYATRNTAVGHESGKLTGVNSNDNTYVGTYAGYNITTPSINNTFIGSYSGFNVSQKVDAVNSMALGYGTYTTASNQVVIGNASVTQTLLNGNVGLGTATPLHKLSGYSTTATNLNAFNFINNTINKVTSTVAQATDTSSFSLNFSSLGSPKLSLKGKTGNSMIYVDSVGVGVGTNTPTSLLNVNGAYNYFTDSSSVNDSWGFATTAITAMTAGMQIFVNISVANTDGATLQINALGAKAVLKRHDQAIITGDVEVGQIIHLIYDGTSWQMLSQLAQ